MKKTIKIMLTLALVIAALCITASAEGTNGFYGIDEVTNVAITAYAGTNTTAIEAKNVDVDADTVADVYYEGSDRLGVTYSAATSGAEYGVILVKGSSLPTASSAIYYINQVTASSQNVAFDVYPATIDETMDMTLYISSSATGAELVSVPMNYVVGYEEVVEPEEPEVTIIYGDVNGDTLVGSADAMLVARKVADWPVTINEVAADVNLNGLVDSADAMILARKVADWPNFQVLPIGGK